MREVLKQKKKIIIIDFGSQVTKLIARRIRELSIYCEIINLKDFKKITNFKDINGIILSGGPSTVTQKKYPSISKSIFEKNIPILGICYGLQLIAKVFGGRIKKSQKKREFGEALLSEKSKSILFKDFFLKPCRSKTISLDFFIFFLRNLLASIGLSERATKLDKITAEARVIAV